MDFDLEEAIPILERTPSVISELLCDLPEKWTRVDEGPETWSPREVVAHLINGEHTDWIPRARIILRQKNIAGLTRSIGSPTSRHHVPFASCCRNSKLCAAGTWRRCAGVSTAGAR